MLSPQTGMDACTKTNSWGSDAKQPGPRQGGTHPCLGLGLGLGTSRSTLAVARPHAMPPINARAGCLSALFPHRAVLRAASASRATMAAAAAQRPGSAGRAAVAPVASKGK